MWTKRYAFRQVQRTYNYGGRGERGEGQEAVYGMPARNYSKISVDKAKTIKRKKYNNSTELKHLHYET